MNDVKTFTYQARLKSDPLQGEILKEYGSLYGAVERHLFRDLIKKLPLNSLKSTYLVKYGITARQFNACHTSVKGKIDSLEATLKDRIEQLKEKIVSLDKKLLKIKDKEIAHHKKRKLISMKQSLSCLQRDQKEGNLSLCFGGKKLFHAQFHLEKNKYSCFEEWKEDWRQARHCEFFSLGSKDETSGNQSCVLTLSEANAWSLRLRLPNTLEKTYGSKYLTFSNLSFKYGHEEISQALAAKKALSYRFKEDEKGWRVFISFSREKAPVLTKKELGSIGIDINVDHIAVTEIDRNGNPIDKITYPLCTYGKKTDQAKALIGDVCKKIVEFAKEKQKPIIAEKLDFKKKKARLKEESSSKLARMISSFSYSHILENLERKAFREGVGFFTVLPAFSSIIGRVKFAKRYGLSVHHAAALCIARRLFKFSEAPSRCPMKVVHKNVQVTCPLPERNRRQHVWTFWKEASKKLKTALAAHFRSSPVPRSCRSG